MKPARTNHWKGPSRSSLSVSDRAESTSPVLPAPCPTSIAMELPRITNE